MKKLYLTLFCILAIILSTAAISAANTTENTDDNVLEDNTDTLEKDTNIISNTQDIETDDNSQCITEDTSANKDTTLNENAYKKTNSNTTTQKTIKEEKNIKKETQTLTFSKGTHYLNSTMNILTDTEITGEDKTDTILIANTTDTLFNIAANTKLTLNNITIKNFNSTSSTAITNYGTLEVNNCILENNSNLNGSSYGGTIYNEGTLTITDSEFSSNYASSRGASIFNKNMTTIIRSQFTKDDALNVGGSIYNLRGTVKIYDSKMMENTGVSGAAIYNAFGELYINNTDFIKNTATSFYGGAIYSTGKTCMTNSRLLYNHATYDGGAITNTHIFTAVNCSFESNTAGENGGAIENIPWTSSETGNLTLINCNFTENMAVKNGGVIINYNTTPQLGNHGKIIVRQCIFKSNNAGENGGVIYNMEDALVDDSIELEYNVFVDNEASAGSVLDSPEHDIKSADYNWWGTNNPNWEVLGVNPTKWVVMTFTNTTSLLEKLETKLSVTLNTLNTNEQLNEELPEREVIYLGSNATFKENIQTIKLNVTNTVTPETNNITAKIDNQKISITPIETNITYKLIDENQTLQVIYNLPDDINGKTTLKLNGITILDNVEKITNGKKTINYSIPTYLNNNKYTMTVVLATNTGESLRKNITITIPKRSVDVKISFENNNQPIRIGDTIQIVADITTGNKTVNGGRVAFKINGITIKTNVSVVNGKAIVNYTIPHTFNNQKYTITAVYSGTYNKESCRYNTTLALTKQDVHVNPNSTLYLMSDAGVSITFTLLDLHDNYVTHGRVCYKINNQTLKTNITLNEGTFTFDYITPSVVENETKILNFTIVMGENSKYNSMRLTMKIVIS